MKRLVVALLILTTACTDASRTRRVLTDNGYTPINVGGHASFACGKNDTYATRFSAHPPGDTEGKRVVRGVVCCGTWKYCTIRTD